MSRTVLIILAVLAAVIVLGVLAWGRFGGREAATEGTPRIAIVTDHLLKAAADANALEVQQSAWIASGRREAILQVGDGGPTVAAPAVAVPAAGDGTPPPQAASSQASFLRAALTDELEAQVNKMLTASRRFSVMDASSVRTAIERLSISRAEEEARKRAGTAQSETAGGALVEAFGQVAQQTAQPGTTQVSGSAQTAGGSTAFSASQVVDSLEKGDLAGAAAELDARYLLAASLREPKMTWEYALVDNVLKYRIEADPVFVYRLYDVRKDRTVISDATQLDTPVVVEVSVPLENRSVEGAIQSANFETELLKARRELSNKVQERVARHIADAVLEATFPALLSSVSPMIMNRGANDGVAEGEEVTISRASGEIKDGDVVIDTEESPVGTARVVRVRSNSAELQAISGSGFAKSDIVRLTGAGGGASTASSGGGSGRGLGREDILANRANAERGGVIRERVAVGNLRITRDDTRIAVPNFDRAVAERLAREPRIEVMSREALGALADERAIGGARKSYERGGGGVGRAGYVVLGDVTVDVRRSAQTIDVPGAKARETSVSYALVANGSLRIERTDSRLIDSFQVSASAPIGASSVADTEAARKVSEAFADAAARAILPRLFPMEVVSVEGGSIVLNRGQDIGLKAGAQYAIYALGDPIIDSTTGAQISAGVRRQVGTVRIDDVQQNVSIASVVGDGGRIATGQIAEPVAGAARAASSVASGATRRASSAPKENKSEEPAVPF